MAVPLARLVRESRQRFAATEAAAVLRDGTCAFDLPALAAPWIGVSAADGATANPAPLLLEPFLRGGIAALLAAPPPRLLVVPISHADARLGSLALASGADRAEPFDDCDLRRALMLAQEAAGRLERVWMRERAETAERLLRAQEQLRVLGGLTSVVVHEIRNALVPLRTALDLLPERRGDASFLAWFGTIARAETERVENALRQLPRPVPEPEHPIGRVDLGDAVLGVTRLFEAEARSRRIQFTVHYEEPGPFEGVESEIRHAVATLLLDAMQGVGLGGRVALGLRCGEDGEIELWVEDDGRGGEASRPTDALEPEECVRETRVGLGYVQDVVGRHGGSIAVLGGASAGTRVLLRFPGPVPP